MQIMEKGEIVFRLLLVYMYLIIPIAIYYSFRIVTRKFEATNQKTSVLHRLFLAVVPFLAHPKVSNIKMSKTENLIAMIGGVIGLIIIILYFLVKFEYLGR